MKKGLTINIDGRKYMTPKLTRPVDGRLIYGDTRIEVDKIPKLYTLEQVEESIVKNIIDGKGIVHLVNNVGNNYSSNINVLLKNHVLELSNYYNDHYKLYQHDLKDTDVDTVYINDLGKSLYTKNGKVYTGDKVLDVKIDDIRYFDTEFISYTDGTMYSISECKYYDKKLVLLDGRDIALAEDGTYVVKSIRNDYRGYTVPTAAIIDDKVFPFEGYDIYYVGSDIIILYNDLTFIVLSKCGTVKKYKIKLEDKNILLNTIKCRMYVPYGDKAIEGFYDIRSLISYKHGITVKDNGIYKGDTMILARFGDLHEKEVKGDIVSFVIDDGTNNTFIVTKGGSDIFSVKVSKNKRKHSIVGEKVCLVDRSTLTVFHMDELRVETINLSSTMRNISPWQYARINISEYNGKVLIELGNEILAVVGGN